MPGLARMLMLRRSVGVREAECPRELCFPALPGDVWDPEGARTDGPGRVKGAQSHHKATPRPVACALLLRDYQGTIKGLSGYHQGTIKVLSRDLRGARVVIGGGQAARKDSLHTICRFFKGLA